MPSSSSRSEELQSYQQSWPLVGLLQFHLDFAQRPITSYIRDLTLTCPTYAPCRRQMD